LFMEAPACSSETFLCTYKMADTTWCTNLKDDTLNNNRHQNFKT
jgi:hypothetical protein